MSIICFANIFIKDLNSNWYKIHNQFLKSKTKDVGILHSNISNVSFEEKLEKSKNSDYRLYGGVRATLVFHPRWGLPSKEELKLLCEETRPMMYTQLWRKWDPINIPNSSKHIDVLGFKKHTLLEDEDFDIAFPCIENSDLTTSYHTRMSLFWPMFSDSTVSGRSVAEKPGRNSINTSKISYAAISRK